MDLFKIHCKFDWNEYSIFYTMNILLIGGTGLVGSYLLPKLSKAGHNVFALTRSTWKVPLINKLGAHALQGDILNPDSFTGLVKNPDLIILLAMPAVKPGKRITKRRFDELKEETTGFFRNSIDLAKRYHIPVILPGGTSYNTRDGEVADETWPIYRKGLSGIGEETDIIIDKAIEKGTPKVVQLIYGKIYGNGGLFRLLFEWMQKGKFRTIGNGENCIPNIHADDAAEAILKSVEKIPVGEKFIIADDFAVSQTDFNCHIADLLKLEHPKHIPGFIIRMVLGKDLYQVVTMNCRVTNIKAKTMLGWVPGFPSYREGLENAIGAMVERKPYFSKI